jgi:hypothetical protein
MIQAPEPPAVDVIVTLVKLVGAPAVMFFGFVWVFRRLLLPKQNGQNGKALAAENHLQTEKFRDYTDAQTRELKHHLDMAVTQHFDQLRRDLERKIETTTENSLQAYFFQRYEMSLRRKEGP